MILATFNRYLATAWRKRPTDMSETYEVLLADLLSELVAVSLEYSNNSVSDVFVYASTEQGWFFIDPFFASHGEIVERHKLAGVDTSDERQDAFLAYGTKQLAQFAKECSALDYAVPTEIKVHYVVATGKTDASQQYEAQHSNTSDVSVHDKSEEWMEEVRLLVRGRS